MMPSVIIAFDPGVTGAYAVYWPDEPDALIVRDFPTVAGYLDANTLARRIAEDMNPGDLPLAVIEQVHSMPKQGVASTFKFGTSYGTLLGIVAAYQMPTHLVTPGKWKRHHGLSSDKEASRALALRLWPGTDYFSRKKDHGRAEAALIALYAHQTMSHARAAA